MIATIIGGFMFLGCQALEWSHLHHEGYWWGAFPASYTGVDTVGALQFSNLFFTITGFHGFHVFTGVLINIIILFMVLANVFQKSGSYLMVEKVGLYWHFVDLVWVFVFTFFYLV
jgi:cytochrome c oxidase subunit 3